MSEIVFTPERVEAERAAFIQALKVISPRAEVDIFARTGKFKNPVTEQIWALGWIARARLGRDGNV